jgi:hypothetical protein
VQSYVPVRVEEFSENFKYTITWHTVHPRQTNNKIRKSFSMRCEDGKSYVEKREKKKKKTEKSIPVNTKCHTKTDRAITGTLRSDTETCRYQGWPHRRCSQGWRKCQRLSWQRYISPSPLLQFSFLRTFITFNCTNFTDTVMTRV